MRALYVAPNICNNCYNRLFIGFCSDGHHMSMKCCSINMLHGVMKCVRRHRGLHRRFGLFWVVCVRHHKRPHCQFCNLLLQCVIRSYMLLYVRLIRVRGTPRFRTMWDCTYTDERELVGRLPFVFLYVRCSDNDPRDDKTRATPLGMALVLFAKEAPWGLGSRGCWPAEATVSYDLRNVWFCAFVPGL